jgi:hypothetical protein
MIAKVAGKAELINKLAKAIAAAQDESLDRLTARLGRASK